LSQHVRNERDAVVSPENVGAVQNHSGDPETYPNTGFCGL
jgi:hypothetical protein